MMQVTAMPRPMAVLLSASEMPFASSAERSSGLAAETAPNARMRPTTVPRRPTRVAMLAIDHRIWTRFFRSGVTSTSVSSIACAIAISPRWIALQARARDLGHRRLGRRAELDGAVDVVREDELADLLQEGPRVHRALAEEEDRAVDDDRQAR